LTANSRRISCWTPKVCALCCFLPPNVTIELETEGVTRPKVVVYETTRLGKQKSLMYLQLVMMAGK